MKKIILLVVMLGVLPGVVSAHLCNDVFRQAHDHLAVKVDIRDGQLRISDNATFKVYLLNTMDRTIDDIHLEILTDDFEATVTPESEWKSFPRLKVNRKQYFDVELTRKSGTEAGKYNIDLRLICDDRDLKTVAINEVLPNSELMIVPENPRAPKVDGAISSAEWKNSLLCTSLLQSKTVREGGKRKRKNLPAEIQTRFRFSQHQETLYGLIDFMQQDSRDVAKIHIAQDYESKPIVLVADLSRKKVFLEDAPKARIQAAFNGTKVEFALPFEVLQITKQQPFHVNLSRKSGKTSTFWRGDRESFMVPFFHYATFAL